MESMWSNKYKELTDHFQREQAKASALARDLDKVKNEKHLCDKELANFHGRFKDLENVKNQREQELNQLRAQLQVRVLYYFVLDCYILKYDMIWKSIPTTNGSNIQEVFFQF